MDARAALPRFLQERVIKALEVGGEIAKSAYQQVSQLAAQLGR